MPIRNDYIYVNTKTRDVTIPNDFIAGVYNDKDVKVAHFQIDRYAGDIDLFTYLPRINYLNANRVGDQYYTNPVIDPDDDKFILIDWVLGRNCFAAEGVLVFNVCLRKTASTIDAQVVNEWNSKVAHTTVYEGLETDQNAIISDEQYSDLYYQLQNYINDKKPEMMKSIAGQALDSIVSEENNVIGQIRETSAMQQASAAMQKDNAAGYAAKAAEYADKAKASYAANNTKIFLNDSKLFLQYEGAD